MSDEVPPVTLPDAHRAALLELGSKGSGGQFDSQVMSSLFTLGLVEISSGDRRLVLTAEGRRVYQALRDGSPD